MKFFSFSISQKIRVVFNVATETMPRFELRGIVTLKIFLSQNKKSIEKLERYVKICCAAYSLALSVFLKICSLRDQYPKNLVYRLNFC